MELNGLFVVMPAHSGNKFTTKQILKIMHTI